MTPPMLLRTCPGCGGRGRRPIPGLPGLVTCSTCSGSGKVKEEKEMSKEIRCVHCGAKMAWNGSAGLFVLLAVSRLLWRPNE
jgi:DnaJ-class molecular chaperone